MIAYNTKEINNLAIVKKAKEWYSRQLISSDQMTKILGHYKTGFYSPNLFVKIGLFIFTLILVSAAVGFYSMFFFMLFSGSEMGFAIFTCLLFGIACIVSLEVFIRQKKVYRSGMDEALLYAGLGFIIAAIGIIFEEARINDTLLIDLVLSLPFLIAAIVRYTDRFISLLCIISVYAIFFLLLLKLGEAAKLIMPFALMAVSAPLYLGAKKYKKDGKYVYWKGCFTVVECIALLVFYLACNYFVIRESSIEFFNMELAEGSDIPLAILFYLLTAAVPIFYIYQGLRKKDKVILWIGLLLLTVAVLTFKYYFSLGHPEISLTLAGIIMIGIAYATIRYLKTDRHGLTFIEEPNEDNFLKSNMEALLVAQTYGQSTHTQATESTTEMGGGEFGGGGAGAKF